MKIKKEYKIYKSASTDRFRPALCGIYIDKENCKAIATDGHQLVFVPVEFEETDIIKEDVIIPSEAFVNAAKGLKKNDEYIFIKLEEKRCQLQSGNYTSMYFNYIEETYPNVYRVIPNEEEENSIVFSFNPNILKSLIDSMGSETITMVIKSISISGKKADGSINGVDGIINIYPRHNMNDAVGYLMPIRTDREF